MNKRILKLFNEAGFHQPEMERLGIEDKFKKFAELIVKECCQYLNTEAERLYSLSASEHRPNFKEDFEICAEKCYDNIQGLKDLFGVKE
jgi:hypothetical protein